MNCVYSSLKVGGHTWVGGLVEAQTQNGIRRLPAGEVKNEPFGGLRFLISTYTFSIWEYTFLIWEFLGTPACLVDATRATEAR